MPASVYFLSRTVLTEMIKVRLVHRRGDQRGQRVAVSVDEFTIGRHSSCNLRLDSNLVSRQHCVIALSIDQITVRDLGSRNGTIVNGRELRNESCAVGHRDKLQVGEWKFRISMRDSETGQPVYAKEPPESEPSSSESERESGNDSSEHLSAELLSDLDQLTTKFELPTTSKSGSWRDLVVPEEDAELDTPQEHEEPVNRSTVIEVKKDEKPKAEDSDETERPKDGPMRVPEHLRPKGPANSTNAAEHALRRHFGR